MSPKGVFWNAEQRRLRAGWRLVLQFLLFVAIVLGLVSLSPEAAGSNFAAALLLSLLYLLAVLGSVWLLARLIDHRPFADYGLHVGRAWWLHFGFGLFLGAFMMTGVFVTERIAGWIEVTGPAVTSHRLPIGLAVLVKLVDWVVTGVNEELVFRGYQLKNLAEGLVGNRLGPRAALMASVVVSSMSFGLGHLANENATAVSTFNIILGGFLLSLPVLLTGELAISIGLHVAWNLFGGTFYGFAISGVEPTTHLITIRQGGPELWTGGAFGPEAGLLCIAWMLVICGLVLVWNRFRRQRDFSAL